MKALFYSNGMDVFGPVSIEEFSKNRYYKSTLIWHEGLTGWMPIGDFQELKHLIGTMSAPTLDTVIQQSVAGQTPPLSKMQPAPAKSNTTKFAVATIVVIILGSLFPAYYFSGISILNGDTKTSSVNALLGNTVLNANPPHQAEIIQAASNETEMKTYRMNWTKFILAEPNDFKSNLLVGIEDLKITVKNNSPYLLDSMQVKVDYLKANGDTYQSEILEFENVDANGTKTLYAPNSNRGVKVSCTIVFLHSNAMKMCYDKKDKKTGEDPYLCQLE
jgi:hypothetical protein